MTRKELVRAVADRTGMNPADADRTVKAMLAALAEALGRGDAVQLPGFGTFETRDRPARTGRDPRTGRPVDVPAKRAVRFRAGVALRRAVNG